VVLGSFGSRDTRLDSGKVELESVGVLNICIDLFHKETLLPEVLLDD
jgi:hypothetical protein